VSHLNKIVISLVIGLVYIVLIKGYAQEVQINADFFELDGDKQEVNASGNVTVYQKDAVITGERARFDKEKNVIQLFGNVQFKKDKLIIHCSHINAYTKKDLIEAIGPIKMSYLDVKGEAEKATYNVKQNVITLSGSPKAWQKTDELSGEIIQIDLKYSKITTKGQAKVKFSREIQW